MARRFQSPWLLLAVPVATVAMVFVARTTPAAPWLLDLAARWRELGPAGGLAYGLAASLGFAFFFPGIFLSMGAGFVYGPLAGLWLAYPSTLAGAVIAFSVSRAWLRGPASRLRERFPVLSVAESVALKDGVLLVVLLRLSPLVPFGIQNWGLGASKLPLRALVLGSLAGNLLPAMFHAYVGSLARDATKLAAGQLPDDGLQPLFWIGLVATAALLFVAVRAARAALQARGVVPTEPADRPELP